MSETAIRGQRVVLRPKRLEDAQNDYAWRADEELARLDATAPLRMSFQDYLRLYQDELRRPLPWSRRFAIETVQGKHIGNCMCYDINTVDGEAEGGIMIGDPAYWNNGYGRDSVTLLVDHAFTTLPLNRVYLHTLEWNTRARRSFARVGFKEVGLVRRDGQDFILMELWRRQWEEVRRARQGETPAAEKGALGR